MPHFLCPPSLPRNRASGRPRNNVFITSHLFGPPAAPAFPLPRRRRSFHAAGEGGLARAARPGRARGPGPGRGGAGRVRGLGPHERRLRGGLQPREGGLGFKGAPQLILVIRRGRRVAPRRAGARAGCSGLAPPPAPGARRPLGAAPGQPAGRRGGVAGPSGRGEPGHRVAARVGALPGEVRARNTHRSGPAASLPTLGGRFRGRRAPCPAAPAPAA